MTKIFFISDTHFGKKYSFRRDYNLNISKRNLDAIDNCEIIIENAIEEQADFVIFLGDIYDRRNISPTFRKIVRERIFTPLANSNIQIYVIGGNHDSVRVPERGADIQELSNFPNFDVFTEFKSRIVEKNGLKMGFLFLPYIHYDVLVRMARKRGMKISTTDHNYIIAQRIMRNFISEITEKTLSGCDKRFLMGHYYLSGAKIRETNNPAMIFGDFELNKEIIQKHLFDLAIFGHVHLKQTMWNDYRIVIPGSIDRIDMGERDSDKFYCVYDVESDHLEYIDLACRKMFKFNIELPKNEKNPTDFILNKCPSSEELGGAICNITIKYPKEKKLDIDKDFIKSHFKDCFHSYLNYSEMTETELQHLREANLDPKSLFEDFLKQRYADHEFYEDLKKIGLEIIENAIRSIDVTATGSLSIISIDMQNFNNYGMGPNKLVFEEDLYVIKGPTGTGKSSILDAITFALFKKSFRRDVGLKIDEIIYDGGYVNL